jgi:hypothetical protein
MLIVTFATVLCLTSCGHANKDAGMEQSRSSKHVIADLRDAYAAFNRGDIDAALKPFDSEIEWSEPPEFPGGGTYHGLDGVKSYRLQIG